MRSILVLLCGVLLCEFRRTSLAVEGGKGKNRSRDHPTTREEIPVKRTFEINRQRGVVLERWDGIDGYLCKNLLQDPRFPSMPTYLSYTSTFGEPINWGDNYGSRIRGYFVPQQTGPHVFFIESDNEGQLFLSTTDHPDQKILICKVGKDHETLPMMFRKYLEQESYPINLKKGTYYYIEALHKEQYGNDSLTVAVQTPDKKFYAPIPSQFLWTTAPPKHPENQTSSQYVLVTIAAKAGAKAGATLGMNEAQKSGAQAGAMAGAEAGQKAGAEAGAEAATKAATEVATKALKEALEKLGKLNKPQFNIFTANGSVIPMQPGTTTTTGGQTTTSGESSTESSGQTSQLVNQTGYTSNVKGQSGIGGAVNTTITVQTSKLPSPPGTQGKGHPGIYHGVYVYNREIPYYIPPKTYDPHIIARHSMFLDPRGFARVIVNGAMYVIHAMDVPASQNPLYNLCWRITNGNLELTQDCQAFVVHIPGFDKGTGEHQTISFESVCAPGHYVRQKNYRFVLGKQGDPKFKYDASAAFFQVFSLPGAFQFSLMRKGWYICRSENKDYHRTAIVTDFNMASLTWLKKCSFALRPLAPNENAQMNCFDVIQPPEAPGPQITTPTPKHANVTTPTTLPTVTPTTLHKHPEPCLKFHFWNDAGVPFILYSSLKPEGYLVTGPEIHLHYVIRNGNFIGLQQIPGRRDQISRSSGEMLSETSGELDDTQQLYLDLPKPELSKLSKIVVKFWAKDLYGKRDIFLDGKKVVYAVPGIHCDHHISVTITSKPKPHPSTTKPTLPTVPTTTAKKPTPPSLKLPEATLPPAPPPIPATLPPPPSPPTYFHIHIHSPSPPPRHPPTPTMAPAPPPPPPPPPEPSPPPIPPAKPPPPPKRPKKPKKPKTTHPCGPEVPGVSKTTPRPCLPTTPPVIQPPSCAPTPGPLHPGIPPCKPTTRPPVPPPCSPGTPPPCAPGPVPSPTHPPVPSPTRPSLPPPCFPGSPKPCAPTSVPPSSPSKVDPVTLPTLPTLTTVPPVTAPLPIQGCMPTHGGTSHGACCIFPFIYRGVPQHRCTRAERGYRWCATTERYDADKQWGFCASCFLCYGGNSNGNCCHFPFIYGGKMYTTCTTQDETKPWCATTYNYDVDKQWGYCGGDAPGSVPQPKIAFSPCASDCDGKCVDACPDYCCVKVASTKTSGQTQQVAVAQPSQGQQITEGQQLSHSCPAICAKYCAPDCLVRCCNHSPPITFAPSPPPLFLPPSPPPAVPYCPQICFRTCVNSCPAACCASTRQDINRNAMSYTVTVPCPDSCYPNCHVNCPPQCCTTASKSNTPTSGTLAKRLGCKDSISTIGGNAQGACCNFPFIYKGAVYWVCTAVDAEKKWCSATKVFEIEKKWGFCT